MILHNEPLAKHTCFGVGGPADMLALPETTEELANVLHSRTAGMPITILGGCSNVLINDNGIRGLAIITTKLKAAPHTAGDRLECPAGVPAIFISHLAADNGLSGLEFLCGIPGTIGGAVFGNAGAHGGEMSNAVESVTVMDFDGNIKTIPASELRFAYRSAHVPNDSVIISVTLKLTAGDAHDIKSKMESYKEWRLAKQPVGARTCGSLFKNPDGDFAARLVEAAGWKGREINGAAISDKHANFLVNTGSATAHDLESLATAIHDDVLAKFGINLEWEIKRL
jgi:UDP-N-acetylmuramate dehydrogenase